MIRKCLCLRRKRNDEALKEVEERKQMLFVWHFFIQKVAQVSGACARKCDVFDLLSYFLCDFDSFPLLHAPNTFSVLCAIE